MTYRDLTPEDKLWIKEVYTTQTNKNVIYDMVGRKFDVYARTVRKWAKRLGLSRKYRDRVNHIVVVDHEIVKPPHQAKILLFDIETAPLTAYIWGLWNQNIGHNLAMLQSDWYMLTWSAKWLFGTEIMSDRLTSIEAVEEDDKRITQSLWELINEADVIIAHNGKKFDVKRINTRFLKHDLPQPMPYKLIDTLEHARKQLSVSSNKLDYLGEFLNVGRKAETGGFDLWKRCVKGDTDALIKMETYNKGDVTLLEDVYLKIRRFIKPHPNMGLHITEDIQCCPTCASEELERGGEYHTSVAIYEAFRCKSCGSIGRSRKSEAKYKHLVTPTA
jgi:DNA polymerase elongation subunit (family B)